MSGGTAVAPGGTAVVLGGSSVVLGGTAVVPGGVAVGCEAAVADTLGRGLADEVRRDCRAGPADAPLGLVLSNFGTISGPGAGARKVLAVPPPESSATDPPMIDPIATTTPAATATTRPPRRSVWRGGSTAAIGLPTSSFSSG
jgi:hypothetical protein